MVSKCLQNWFTATPTPTPISVLVDINMPVMDGVEFLHQHQALPFAYRQLMTIVVVSSSAAAADKQRVQALANAYVTKPLTSAVLYQVVHQHLTRCGLASQPAY